MTIIPNSKDSYYSSLTRALGYGYDVVIEHHLVHYEFQPKDKEAIVLATDPSYFLEVVEAFHQKHKAIHTYYTEDHAYYKSYDELPTFLLPVSILQVSQFFLNQERLTILKDYDDNTYFPVQIVEDEYVLLAQHHLLYTLAQHQKMVPVYIDQVTPSILDAIYLAKEQNIKHIEDMTILPKQEYDTIQQQLQTLFKHERGL